MAVKNVYLKKKIEGAIVDIYPHTSAEVVHYDDSTTVADQISSLAEGLAGVITSEQVDAKVKAESDALYNKIMGLTGAEGEIINKAYDTLKEVAEYLAAHGDVVQGFTTDINSLKTTVGNAESGLVKDVADLTGRVTTAESEIDALQTTVGNAESGLVKDVADIKTNLGELDATELEGRVDALETTVGDAESGLVKDVADLTGRVTTAESEIDALQTTVAAKGAVVVSTAAPSVDEADENSLYVVVDA